MDEKYFDILKESLSETQGDSQKEFKNFPPASFNQGYYKHFFRESKRLGKGARGSVFLTQHRLEDELLGIYAIKKIPIGDNQEWFHKIIKEVHILEALKHPNIINYKHSWMEVHQPSPFSPSIPCLFILMEYANFGDLEDYVLGEDLSMSTIIHLFTGIAKGLEHLHHFGIIHRDLKPQNILLHLQSLQTSTYMPEVLISDFGECNRINQESKEERTGATGTIEFCAPELFYEEKGHFLFEHSVKSDVWSLGMIFYFMIWRGQLPFSDIEDVDVLRDDLIGLESIDLPKMANGRTVAEPIRDLLKWMLSVDPSKRPFASQVVQALSNIHILTSKKSSSPPLISSTPSHP